MEAEEKKLTENDQEAVHKCKKDCNNVYVSGAIDMKKEEPMVFFSNNCLIDRVQRTNAGFSRKKAQVF
jgi:hypothetical protein